MGIKIIINGYYRSGTTFVWDFLKESLEDHICFYEPLHPDLAISIRNEENTKIKDKIHKKELWQEYIKLDEIFLDEILRNNPNKNKEGIISDNSIIEYFNLFQNLEKNILIQPNRAHFHLNLIAKKYNCKIVHIIRHPLDVFYSMENMYYNRSNSILKKFIKKITKIWAFPSVSGFSINKEYSWIIKNTGYPIGDLNNWKIKFLCKGDYFGKIILIWTLSNYYAIKNLEKTKGKLVIYENLLENPNKVLIGLEKYLNIRIENKPKIKKNNFFKFEKKELKKMLKTVKKYQIEKEFQFIINKLKEYGIDYEKALIKK